MSDELNKRAAELMGWTKTNDYMFFNPNDGYIYCTRQFWGEGELLEDKRPKSIEEARKMAKKYEVFDPCNRIEHAWMLVEWLVSKGIDVEISLVKDTDVVVWAGVNLTQEGIGLSDTAPLAITRAFVEALDE